MKLMSTQKLESSPSRRGGRRNANPVGEAVGPEGLGSVGKAGWGAVSPLLAPVSGAHQGQDGEMMGEYQGQALGGGASR